MKLILCSVKDSAVEAFEPPMAFRARGEAIRGFMNACGDKESMPAKYPAHYSMFYLGDFDTETGVVTQPESPECLARALDFITES